MTLRDLLRKCSYKNVFNIIHKEYYKGKFPEEKIKEADQGYLHVYYELQSLKKKPSEEYQIYICREEDAGGEKFIDVALYCAEDEQVYAIDLTPWEDLIDAEIKNDTEFQQDKVLAHILWEITFYGFRAERVKLERIKLKELCDRIDSGEEKLTPWEGINDT